VVFLLFDSPPEIKLIKNQTKKRLCEDIYQIWGRVGWKPQKETDFGDDCFAVSLEQQVSPFALGSPPI